jgi:hydroxymethyl cephem carbamoyltransferase
MSSSESTYSDAHLSILGFKPGHDGSVAHIVEGDCRFVIEAEKADGLRYSPLSFETVLHAMELCEVEPNVLAISGWSIGHPRGSAIGAGYCGLERIDHRCMTLFGRRINTFSSSHERSHLLSAYGMSPFPHAYPCLALIWEGHIGAIYYIDQQVCIRKLANILDDPGVRYGFLFALADPTFPFPTHAGAIRLGDAGKLMALAAYSSGAKNDPEVNRVVNYLLDPEVCAAQLTKEQFSGTCLYNCGVTDQRLKGAARALSNALYERFEAAARKAVSQHGRLPLLIAGGCGLNCEWNSRFIASGLFEDVFVPPCANDSGSAIGTAIDAMHHFTGRTKITWHPYLGQSPRNQGYYRCDGFMRRPLDIGEVAAYLAEGKVVAWVNGRYEIGPRALGARSLLASPLRREMLDRLNEIKQRESFRPIAPVCLEEDMNLHFYPADPSPYMLEFRQVISRVIPAVTHVDGSARPQSVNKDQNPTLFSLLRAFKAITGVGVLCNTSANFKGHGFINSIGDLARFATERGVDAFVFEGEFFPSS